MFVTAWNPLGRRRPEGWNRRMQARLREHARRLPSVPGRGEGGGWFEEHVLVCADPRRVTVLARRFRQLAVVIAAPGRPARLAFIGRARP